MKRNLIALLATLFLAISTLFVIPQLMLPANAGWPGGWIQHAADDSGYNPPIYIKCSNGNQYSLGLGTWSKSLGGCDDVDQMYVGAGDQIKCQRSITYTWTLFDATGWHNIGDRDAFYCYQQKD